mgnify:CR=1 FL=1
MLVLCALVITTAARSDDKWNSALLADSKMSDHSDFRKAKLLMLNTVSQKGTIATLIF